MRTYSFGELLKGLEGDIGLGGGLHLVSTSLPLFSASRGQARRGEMGDRRTYCHCEVMCELRRRREEQGRERKDKIWMVSARIEERDVERVVGGRRQVGRLGSGTGVL